MVRVPNFSDYFKSRSQRFGEFSHKFFISMSPKKISAKDNLLIPKSPFTSLQSIQGISFSNTPVETIELSTEIDILNNAMFFPSKVSRFSPLLFYYIFRMALPLS